jgi:hypothetical protein
LNIKSLGEALMAIVIEKSAGLWVAVRDIKLELATPRFEVWTDLAEYLLKQFPSEPVGVLAEDIAGERGTFAAKLTTGSSILWVRGKR